MHTRAMHEGESSFEPQSLAKFVHHCRYLAELHIKQHQTAIQQYKLIMCHGKIQVKLAFV